MWTVLPGRPFYMQWVVSVIHGNQTTTYVVTVTNSKGCKAKDSITVLADFTKAVSTYPVPSAFTPNNDGRNDCFGLKRWGVVTELQFQIFNRWGERVFSTTDVTQCWDGRYKGVLQPAGGYAYQIKAVTLCGTVNRTGMVMLIR
jgi:gliding motility-associated-like protein